MRLHGLKSVLVSKVKILFAGRHPDTDASKFIDYMESTLSKIETKNKIICVMGDFNLNLLNYETHTLSIPWYLIV